MHLTINGVRLYVDIEGSGLVADGPVMREKPTLVLVHGGPGADHTVYKPAFSQLCDIAQIVYYDHRGCGRSEDGPRERWTLAQWGDDLKSLCDTLGLEKPIVLGTSFGGFVAQAYATQHPGHPAKLILMSTAAKIDFETIYATFERVGGATAREAAHAYWSTPSDETRGRYREICLPLYQARHSVQTDWFQRAITRNATGVHFNGPHNEHGRMDYRADLARVTCPVLVMAGELDPITPIAFSETIAASLSPGLARFERFPDCGHGLVGDDPDRTFRLIREFIST